MKSGNIPDYEAKTSYSVTVTVTAAAKSQGANAQSVDPNAPGDYVVPVTINVTDVNEPPPKMAAPTATQNTATPKTKLDVSWTALTTTQMAGKPRSATTTCSIDKRAQPAGRTHPLPERDSARR